MRIERRPTTALRRSIYQLGPTVFRSVLEIDMTEVDVELIKLLSGIPIAVVTAWVTVWLALRRFRSERWWERRVENYTALFVALHEMQTFLRASQEDQRGNTAQGAVRMAELSAKWMQGQDQLAKALDIGLFVFSRNALNKLEGLQHGLREASVNDFSNIQPRIKLIEECLSTLRHIALEDLQVNDRWLRGAGA